ncbi:MAG: spinster family MFS transporter [Steroidobacteraceae bacterium]
MKARDWTAVSVYSLGFLTLISSFNYFDRSLLGLVLPLIKAEMQVSDTVLGLVSGLAFVLFYSLLGVPMAWAADRWSRRNIIAAGFLFWSAMTALTGFVANIWQLALARFLMGAGEACGVAPSNSMIADLYRPARRPLALSIFGTAFAISSIVFFPIAGRIAEAHGWRAAFVAAGVPGALLAILFLATVKEPARGASEARTAGAVHVAFAETLRFLSGARTYMLLLAGVTFMGADVYAVGAWNSTLLARVHGLKIHEIANIIGPFRGILVAIGVVSGGILTDRLGRRNPRWRLYVPGLACLAVVPADLTFLLGDVRSVWLGGFAVSSLLTLLHQGPVYAAVMNVAKLKMRATATALLLLCSSLLGQFIGPLLVGWLNDRLARWYGLIAIRYSMLVLVLCVGIAGLCFLFAARTLEADTRRAAGD